MRIMSLRGEAAIRQMLVFSVAVFIAATRVLAGDLVPPADEGPGQSVPSATPPAPAYERPPEARPCYFGPFMMRVDPFEVHRIAEAVPSGREALQRVLALEEDPELPPYRFRVATEDDGGDDITCR